MPNNIILFNTNDGQVSLDVRLDGETVWLSLDQISALFERKKSDYVFGMSRESMQISFFAKSVKAAVG